MGEGGPEKQVAGVFPPNIARRLHGVKLLGRPTSADFDFSSKLVMKRVAKSIQLMDVVAKINDPRCELLLLRACAECIVTASSPLVIGNGGSPPYPLHCWGCVLCYRLGVPLYSVPKPCSAYSRVFAGHIYGDHDVSYAGIIGIKHRHNIVHDTLVEICFRSGISAGKEVDTGLGGGRNKPLRPADMLLYSWDGGLDAGWGCKKPLRPVDMLLYSCDGDFDVCVDRSGSSPLSQTGMADFVLGRAMIADAQCKRVSYRANGSQSVIYLFNSAIIA
ncbi:hypothetical protein Tco_1093771 [Tanacetum coccineum]|uniref:Uncharacterized protein n=1 Tax=Tanacetum coccineum TaxID=301880 RepID=A0ABQ5IDM0_9ASTR